MTNHTDTETIRLANLVYSLKGRFQTDVDGNEHSADLEAMDAADAIEALTEENEELKTQVLILQAENDAYHKREGTAVRERDEARAALEEVQSIVGPMIKSHGFKHAINDTLMRISHLCIAVLSPETQDNGHE